MRRGLTEFNSERFAAETAAIDAVIRQLAVAVEDLPGGVRIARIQPALPACELGEWHPSSGSSVVWTWVAFDLDGDSLTSGRDEFILDRDAVPQAFHESAKRLGHRERVQVWSPSATAFGVRGVPGSIPPYTPVRLDVQQERSIRDTSWRADMRRDSAQESCWLRSFMQSLGGKAQPVEVDRGLHVAIHSQNDQPWEHGTAVDLRIRTAAILGGAERETAMEWEIGTPDQLVPALERALSEFPSASTLTVWATSVFAFGRKGVPSAGLPASTPVRFDLEVRPREGNLP